MNEMQSLMQTLKSNATVMRHPVRHICTPIDQIIIQIYMLCYILLNVTIQSHVSKNKHVK